MASFESINYSIRPNKNIERKLMFEGLQRISETYSLKDHVYVGMGSMWFSDFILAHRELRISEMISFELPDYASRAEFNRPYDCIKVISGDTTTQLPNLNWERPMVMWLDYDSDFTGPLFEDIPLIANSAVAGTVVAITINAHLNRLPTIDDDQVEMSRPDAIKHVWGSFIPRNMQPPTAKRYAEIAGGSMLNMLKEGIRKRGAGMSFFPLFHFFYSDGAPMVTVGGIVLDQSITEDRIGAPNIFQSTGLTGEQQSKIAVPPLTPRERHALDKMMPASNPATELIVQSKFGFTLPQHLLDEYFRFYRLYPTFVETMHS
jgi:hypothetical protein